MQELLIKKVTITVDGNQLFTNLTIRVTSAAPTTLMGPSGSGKSSLLNWLSGNLPANFTVTGNAYFNGEEISGPPHLRRLGILFQDDLLFPHMNVAENLAFGLRNPDKAARAKIVAEALEKAGLADFQNRVPETLSGGQKARIALLRVLLSEPRALLLDEPFSKLDLQLRRRFRAELFSLTAKAGIPVLQVTHDHEDAMAAGGQIIELEPLLSIIPDP